MANRYDEREARRYLARYAAWGDALALRVYTSHLIGSDPSLVLHGGGNTSVKVIARDAVEGDVEVLYVKGSGWDLASIEPLGFPALRLTHLRRMLECERLSDEEMVNQQRTHLLDYRSPSPSVEALLHALLPERFVDHTHADAILTLTDQPDGVERARALYGPQALVLEYCMAGFVLAKRVASRLREHPNPSLIILAKHGIFTAGETARQSYERMIDAVETAEHELARARAFSLAAPAPPDRARRRDVALSLRGALAERGMRVVTAWCQTEEALTLSLREDAAELCSRGPITPDHVLRTRPWPALLELRASEAPHATVERALDAYASRYRNYVEAGIAHLGQRTPLDALPRVAVVPGLGICAWGATKSEAHTARDIAEHTARTILRAEAIGRYEPISPLEIFEMEYWTLEQAKLRNAAHAPAALDGRIAIVTGGASGIGRATAAEFARHGAHVLIADRDADSLKQTCEQLSPFGERIASLLCDVTGAGAGEALVNGCCDAFGGIDILVSNAGIAPSGLLHTAEGEAALARSLEVNFYAHQRLARAAFEAFVAQRCGGTLLFNLSKQTFAQSTGFGPYGVAKTAALALMRQYALDGGRYGIRANAVNADRVRTTLFTPELAASRAAAHGVSVEAYFAGNLLRREVQAADVAQAFRYLATAEATTGCVLTVDGGVAAAFPR
ncbi:bifunctional aldolase/short-chain dehydrogenase [bacterium]|nr:MAG: bifunctional aldolase/short-chain dehydrogenase [bacterium]